MTAIKETFANHSFTSATIITKQSFNLTRSNIIFHVKAAFPTSEVVFAIILLIPEEDLFNNHVNENFALLMNYHKTIKAGYISRPDQYNTLKYLRKSPKLSEFANYYNEFRQANALSTLSWSIDGNLESAGTNSINVTCNDQDCKALLKKAKFKLAFTLFIGAYLEGGDMQEVMNMANNWWCSSMIIDYIRVYELGQFENFNETHVFDNSTGKRASDICDQVSKDLGRFNPTKVEFWKFNYICLIISILVFFIIYLAVRLWKVKHKMIKRTKVNENSYETIILPDILSEMRHNSLYCENEQGVNEYECITYADVELEN